jgi:amino acid transporter
MKAKKVLSVFSLAMMNVIAIDSIRNLPMNASIGLSIVGFYLLGTLFFLLPSVLMTAELATSYPKTGGAYVWVREAFGNRLGFMTIWLQWIYNVIWFPTILIFIASTATYLFDPSLANSKTFLIPTVIIAFMLATFLNLSGLRVSSWVSTFGAIMGTIVPMAAIILLGAAWVLNHKTLAIQWPLGHELTAFMPALTNNGNLPFLVVILFSLVGFEMSAVHAEEVREPRKNFPRALLISSLIIVLSLIFSSLAIALVVPQSDLNIVSGLADAYALFLSGFHLAWAMPIVIVMIIVGAFACMAAWVLGPAKGLMVAAQDGNLPKWCTSKSVNGVPAAILLLQALIVSALVSLFLIYPSVSSFYWILSDLTAQLALFYYVILFAALIKLRGKSGPREKGFLIPGGKVGLWLTGLIGIVTCLFAIGVGFIPPAGIPVGGWTYWVLLSVGMVLFGVVPWVLGRRR